MQHYRLSFRNSIVQNTVVTALLTSLSANLILCVKANAALPTSAPTNVSFFRTKESPFPSGQASQLDLEKNVLKAESNILYKTSWNKNTYSLSEDEIYLDIDTSLYAENKISVTVHKLPQSNSEAIRALSPKSKLHIEQTLGPWALVITDNTQKGWVLKKYLQPRNEDPGVAIPILRTELRQQATNESTIVSEIPEGTRLPILEIKNSFIKTIYSNKIGWVDLWHVIGRMDFAQLAYHPKYQWMEIAHRMNDQLMTKGGKLISISEFKGWYTTTQRALIKNSSPKTPPLRAYLKIEKIEQDQWILSKLDKHGEVWWKRNFEKKDAVSESKILVTEDLLQKELFSIAFKSQNSLAGLVSSEGVWASQDGEHWSPIARFEKNNLPVGIWPGGAWYVGSYRSLDQGANFEPYIRWEKLTEAIQLGMDKSPKQLKILELQPQSPNEVQLLVDTGSKKVRVVGDVRVNNWKMLK